MRAPSLCAVSSWRLQEATGLLQMGGSALPHGNNRHLYCILRAYYILGLCEGFYLQHTLQRGWDSPSKGRKRSWVWAGIKAQLEPTGLCSRKAGSTRTQSQPPLPPCVPPTLDGPCWQHPHHPLQPSSQNDPANSTEANTALGTGGRAQRPLAAHASSRGTSWHFISEPDCDHLLTAPPPTEA